MSLDRRGFDLVSFKSTTAALRSRWSLSFEIKVIQCFANNPTLQCNQAQHLKSKSHLMFFSDNHTNIRQLDVNIRLHNDQQTWGVIAFKRVISTFWNGSSWSEVGLAGQTWIRRLKRPEEVYLFNSYLKELEHTRGSYNRLTQLPAKT